MTKTCLSNSFQLLLKLFYFDMANKKHNLLITHACKYDIACSEGDAEKFSVGHLEGPCRVGVPFNIPLDLLDAMGNPARIDGRNTSPALEARWVA